MSRVGSDLVSRAMVRLERVAVWQTWLTEQQIYQILSAVCEKSTLKQLNLSNNDMDRIEPRLVARAVTRMESVNVSCTQLTEEQLSAILCVICEGSVLKHLDVSINVMSRVDPDLVARAVTKMDTLKVINTDLREEQIAAIQGAAARSCCKITL